MTPSQAPARWRATVLVGLLALVSAGWAVSPLGRGAGSRITLIAAVLAGLGSVAQLAVAGAAIQHTALAGLPDKVAARTVGAVRAVPWAELLTIVLVLAEAEHRARPWHTAVLGLALFSYLFAVHLAETRAPAGVLRPQWAVLAAGAGLLVLAVGAAAVPATATGPAAAGLQIIAAAAALLAGVLATPVWLGRRPDGG